MIAVRDAARSVRAGARWLRLRLDRRSVDAEVRDEIDAHLGLAVDYLVARGVPRDQAEREARARFGDFDSALHRLLVHADRQDRRMHTRRILEELRQDVRITMRLFRRSPAFFLGTLATLAVGIGANVAVFSVLEAALLQPLPYARPQQLFMLWLEFPRAAATPGTPRRPNENRGPLTSPAVLAWRRELAPTLGDIAATLTWQGNPEAQLDLATGDRVVRLNGAFVTPNFFEVLGVRAAHGRIFVAADEPEGTPLVVLSDGLWRRDFAADPAIVGRAITLTGARPRGPHSYVVAGVLPSDVHFTYPVETEAWVMMPWSYVAAYQPRASAFGAVTRLDASVPIAEARRRTAELRAGSEVPASVPVARRPFVAMESVSDWVRGEIRPSLQLLAAVATLLLIVACVTVAGALLASLTSRTHELAVRTALGAGRVRLARQLLTEGALLAVAGAVLGTTLASAMQPLLRALLPASVPRVGSIGVRAPLMLFGAAAAVLTILIATILPAWSGTKVDVVESLSIGDNRGSAGRATKRWQQAVVAAQTALATVLLVSATLLLTSFWRLGRVPLGFDGSEVVTVEMRLLDTRYRQPGSVARFQRQLLERLRAIPGIAQVGLTSAVPFRGTDFTMRIGRPAIDSSYVAKGRYVDADYFGVLRIPLLRGRLFGPADVEGSRRVAVISESLARDMFGAENPLGREILFDDPHEVIGIVADVRYEGRDRDPASAVYFSGSQSPSTLTCVVARPSANVRIGDVAPSIYRAIHDTDPTVPAMKLATIDQIVDAAVANRRFYTVSSVAFAAIALFLTGVGMVAVIARIVAQRRRELAIRAALGARTRDLAWHASHDTAVGLVAGLVAGVVAAYLASPVLGQFLFGVSARSVATYAVVAGLMLAMAGVGIWLPMRRFARVSLSGVLKAE